FFFSSRRRHTRSKRDWSSDVCSSDLISEDKELITFFENNGIHRLTIQDILDVNQRPKFQQFDSYSFLTLKTFQATGQDWKVVHRSEERRVGKECRCRWSRSQVEESRH